MRRRVGWAVFGAWVLVLSGIPALWTEGGKRGLGVFPPGVLQAWRIWEHRQELRQQVSQREAELFVLESERVALERSTVTQERAIRRGLGFVGPHEWVVEFRPSQKTQKLAKGRESTDGTRQGEVVQRFQGVRVH